MKNIINLTTSNDIKQLSKSDINTAFTLLKENSGKIKNLKNISKKIRLLIIGIIELSNEFELNKDSLNLKNNLLLNLSKSDKLEHQGIVNIISDILDPNAHVYNYYTEDNTGLPNRHKLLKDIEEAKDDKLIIILKLNEFKYINTLYGFEGGNSIIRKVKEYFKKSFTQLGFTLYKTSQVNFGLLKTCNFDEINKDILIKKIKAIISNCEIDTDYGNMKIKISGGLAYKEQSSFDNALTALYSTDDSGCLIEYNNELNTKIQKNSGEMIEWTKKINYGLKNGYFIPHYQGIRNNINGKIEKYESLIRYDDGTEIISPSKFLKIAEHLNLLSELSEKMIETVISEMKYHSFDISINLTEQDFLSNKLIKIIENNLNYHSINPSRLTVEVLEDITGDLDDLIINNIHYLQDLGIKISIDDFGTGNSNFARLTKISPDFLKIDGSLVKGVIGKNSKQNIEILRSIIEFGHLHGSKIIAEYIENKEIQNVIDILGIEFSQGHYHSEPSRSIIEN